MENTRIGFFSRGIASLLDGVIILFFSISLSFLLNPSLLGTGEPLALLTGMWSIIVDSIKIITFSTFVVIFMEIFFDASPGKLALGLRIAKSDGEVADIETLTIRAIIKSQPVILTHLATVTSIVAFEYLAGLAGLALFIGFLLALGKRRQTLHDRIADTAIFKRADVVALMPAVATD